MTGAHERGKVFPIALARDALGHVRRDAIGQEARRNCGERDRQASLHNTVARSGIPNDPNSTSECRLKKRNRRVMASGRRRACQFFAEASDITKWAVAEPGRLIACSWMDMRISILNGVRSLARTRSRGDRAGQWQATPAISLVVAIRYRGGERAPLWVAIKSHLWSHIRRGYTAPPARAPKRWSCPPAQTSRRRS